MRDFSDFIGCFGDLNTLIHDTELETYVIRFYDADGNVYYKSIIGYTFLGYDYLLHLVDMENVESGIELEDLVKQHGVEFMLLKPLIEKDGFTIFPNDQD